MTCCAETCGQSYGHENVCDDGLLRGEPLRAKEAHLEGLVAGQSERIAELTHEVTRLRETLAKRPTRNEFGHLDDTYENAIDRLIERTRFAEDIAYTLKELVRDIWRSTSLPEHVVPRAWALAMADAPEPELNDYAKQVPVYGSVWCCAMHDHRITLFHSAPGNAIATCFCGRTM